MCVPNTLNSCDWVVLREEGWEICLFASLTKSKISKPLLAICLSGANWSIKTDFYITKFFSISYFCFRLASRVTRLHVPSLSPSLAAVSHCLRINYTLFRGGSAAAFCWLLVSSFFISFNKTLQGHNFVSLSCIPFSVHSEPALGSQKKTSYHKGAKLKEKVGLL